MISAILSVCLFAICVALLLAHFIDIKKSHNRNG